MLNSQSKNKAMLQTKKAKLFFIICGLFLASFFVFSTPAFAVDAGIEAVQENIALGDRGPIEIITRIINIALGLLGIIAVVIILFAGFTWMTSGGNEEKVEQAKKLLRNAVIGLVIILASWGIVTFILKKLIDATGSGNNAGTYQATPQTLSRGLGSIGSCDVQRVYPEPNQKDVSRNTSIMVTFKTEVDATTICQDANKDGNCLNEELIISNISIAPTEVSPPAPINGKVSMTTDRKTIVIIPNEFLGSPTAQTGYTAKLTNDIKRADGEGGIFDNCHIEYLEWRFEVSDRLDLDPPQVVSIFPGFDNAADLFGVKTSLRAATGRISIIGQANVYRPASVVGVSKNPAAGSFPSANAILDQNYIGQSGDLNVSVLADGTVELRSTGLTDNRLLAAGSFDNNVVIFPGYFSLSVNGTPSAGNSWVVTISQEQAADYIQINNDKYYFVEKLRSRNDILFDSDLTRQAENIAAIISGNKTIEVDTNGNSVDIKAAQAGVSGNSISLSSSNVNSFVVISMSGGVEQEALITKQGEQLDQPMNVMIQINFNEAINPITISGTSEEVGDKIIVLNLNDSSVISGKFTVSNNYKTVEFVSDQECGINGCGEKIYCLPARANIRVELKAGSLETCATDYDCARYNPYSLCNQSCQNSAGDYLPLAKLDGVVDASFNSLDGNLNRKAVGPQSFYNLNNPDGSKGDNYSWSFFVNDQVNNQSPELDLIQPDNETDGINPASSTGVVIDFNRLMASKTLETGITDIQYGDKTIEHKLINFKSFSEEPVGYWVTNRNLADASIYTEATINHSVLSDAKEYISQVGSGVRDIYQNCFTPSVGPNCLSNPTSPSCCFGTPTAALDENGNCKLQ